MANWVRLLEEVNGVRGATVADVAPAGVNIRSSDGEERFQCTMGRRFGKRHQGLEYLYSFLYPAITLRSRAISSVCDSLSKENVKEGFPSRIAAIWSLSNKGGCSVITLMAVPSSAPLLSSGGLHTRPRTSINSLVSQIPSIISFNFCVASKRRQ